MWTKTGQNRTHFKSFFLSLKICRTHQHNGCKSIVNDPVTHVELLMSDPDQQQRRNSRILTSLRLLTIRSPPFLLPPRAMAYGHKRAELHDAQPIGGSSTLFHLLLNANIPAPAQWIAGMRKSAVTQDWKFGVCETREKFYCFMTKTSKRPFVYLFLFHFMCECTFF